MIANVQLDVKLFGSDGAIDDIAILLDKLEGDDRQSLNELGARSASEAAAEYHREFEAERGWINPALPTHGAGRKKTRFGLSPALGADLARKFGDRLTGYVGGPPLPMENAFSDPFNGILGAFAILVALSHRDRTGKGQHIDYSQQEAVMQMVGPAFMDYAMNGRSAAPMGNRHPLDAAAPHGVFPAAGEDRWISIAVGSDLEWQGLVAAMGDPEWARAAEYASTSERVRNIDALHERLAAWTAGFDDRELAERLQRHGVAAAPVLNVADLLHDPHYRARGTFIEVRHPLGFDETIYGAYVKTSRSEARVETGPVIGRDNEHVFKELLGIPEERYRRLVEEQVIY